MKYILFRLVVFSGLEISDVLKIDDKDYSITFSLYFNVQWSEPRLNLSREFLDTENITAEEDQLVPGKWIIRCQNSRYQYYFHHY